MNMVIFGLLMDKFKKFLILINKMILINLIKNIIQIILHELQQDYLNHQHSFNIRNIDKMTEIKLIFAFSQYLDFVLIVTNF